MAFAIARRPVLALCALTLGGSGLARSPADSLRADVPGVLPGRRRPAGAAVQSAPSLLAGVRFAIDTAEIPAPARGAFRTFAGVVQFAAGRGRLDVTTPRRGPTLSVNGVVIAPPLAGTGDYYLFDSTSFVLVRPATRSFSSFELSRSSWRHGDVREADEGFMSFSRLQADTLARSDSARLTQHGTVAVRWHLDRRHTSQPVTILARGWLEVADAPAGEASVVRWFGTARALATMPGGLGELPPDSLQVTAAVIVTPSGGTGAPVNLIVLHSLSGLAAVNVSVDRFILPADFRETSWPGFERASEAARLSRDAGAKWRSIPRGSRH